MQLCFDPKYDQPAFAAAGAAPAAAAVTSVATSQTENRSRRWSQFIGLNDNFVKEIVKPHRAGMLAMYDNML